MQSKSIVIDFSCRRRAAITFLRHSFSRNCSYGKPFVSKIIFYRLTIKTNKNSISEPHVLFLTISERDVTISEPQVIAITEPEVLLPNLSFYFRTSRSISEPHILILNLRFYF